MSTLVVALRILPLLAFAGSMLHTQRGHRRGATARTGQSRSDRAPVVANLAALGLYVPALPLFSSSSTGFAALLLALSGALLALAGVAVVARSRAELGAAWSLVPKADQSTGLVTTGPYRLVRHPIYFGLLLFAMGEALAFGSWPAVMIVLAGIAPTLAWRARVEEQLLNHTFGDRYDAYRRRTKILVPYLL